MVVMLGSTTTPKGVSFLSFVRRLHIFHFVSVPNLCVESRDHEMARCFSQTLTLTLTILPRHRSPKSRLLTLRTQSNQSSKPHQLADLSDLTDSSSDPLVRQLEDAIHRIIVRRSAPDWLPFLPGASYWVPPRPRSCSHGLANLVHQLANPLTQEESMATTSDRGWPSSAYFINGAFPQPVEAEPIPNNGSQPEDEEG